jgi:transposase-like protein
MGTDSAGNQQIGFDLFCLGLSYADIAKRIGVAPRTVARWATQYEWVRKRAEKSEIEDPIEDDIEAPPAFEPRKKKAKAAFTQAELEQIDPDYLEKQILRVSAKFMCATEKILAVLDSLMDDVEIKNISSTGDLPVLNMMTNIIKNTAQTYRLVVPDAPAHVRNRLIAELQGNSKDVRVI